MVEAPCSSIRNKNRTPIFFWKRKKKIMVQKGSCCPEKTRKFHQGILLSWTRTQIWALKFHLMSLNNLMSLKLTTPKLYPLKCLSQSWSPKICRWKISEVCSMKKMPLGIFKANMRPPKIFQLTHYCAHRRDTHSESKVKMKWAKNTGNFTQKTKPRVNIVLEILKTFTT